MSSLYSEHQKQGNNEQQYYQVWEHKITSKNKSRNGTRDVTIATANKTPRQTYMRPDGTKTKHRLL